MTKDQRDVHAPHRECKNPLMEGTFCKRCLFYKCEMRCANCGYKRASKKEGLCKQCLEKGITPTLWKATRDVLKCPKCGWQRKVVSTNPGPSGSQLVLLCRNCGKGGEVI